MNYDDRQAIRAARDDATRALHKRCPPDATRCDWCGTPLPDKDALGRGRSIRGRFCPAPALCRKQWHGAYDKRTKAAA